MAMISVLEARQLILADAKPLQIETIPISDSCGRVAAEDIQALRSQPPYDASAMDGYAALQSDAVKGRELKVIGEAPAGSAFDGLVNPGEAVRIFTGGQIPKGCDHIIIQENVARFGDKITITEDHKAPAHIRKMGIDFKQGETVVDNGSAVSAIQCSILASAGLTEIAAYRKPRIAIFSNGDELVEIGKPAGADDIISSTPAALQNWVRQWGGEPVYLGIARDNMQSLADIIDRARGCDVIVPLGGASVGDYDLVKDAFIAAGYQSVFSKIAVKPGKPTWYGRLGSAHILGLPGNPASGLVCAEVFLKPLVQALSGQTIPAELPFAKAELTEAVSSNGPRAVFARAFAELDEQGKLQVTPFPRQDSSLLTPFAKANCFIHIPPNHTGSQSGDLIEIVLFGGVS